MMAMIFEGGTISSSCYALDGPGWVCYRSILERRIQLHPSSTEPKTLHR
jgi:hypothetical protein